LDCSTYRAERAAIVLLYAAKIAAAQVSAPRDQVAAIIAALRLEERSALRGLLERERHRRNARRRARFGFTLAKRNVSHRRQAVRSLRRRRRFVAYGRIRVRFRIEIERMRYPSKSRVWAHIKPS
jgi:hypothetical protein